jgi:hypothetical protein
MFTLKAPLEVINVIWKGLVLLLALESTQPLTMSTRNLPGGKGRPERKADLIAIFELTVQKM